MPSESLNQAQFQHIHSSGAVPLGSVPALKKKKKRQGEYLKTKKTGKLAQRGQKSPATHGKYCGSYQSHFRLYIPPALMLPSEQCAKGTV